VSKTLMAVTLQVVVMVAWAFVTRLYYSRLILAYFAILFGAGVILIRVAASALLRRRHRSGQLRRVMLVGGGHIADQMVERIRRHPELLYEVVGVLHPSSHVSSANAPNGHPQDAAMSSLDVLDFLRRMRVEELIILLPQQTGFEFQNFLVRCQAQGLHVNVLPQPYELYVSRPRLIEIDGVPLISLEGPKSFKGAAILKRVVDLAFAPLLLIPAILILIPAAAALWFRERRFLHSELRCGLNGEPFWMHRLDVEREENAGSRLDRFLWRTSISELPQLWNVIQGRMSLVGPRPESAERVRHYSDWQRQRLTVKPGMTGLAQVNGLREQHPSDNKCHYDLRYIYEWTPWLDLVLLLQTVWALAARFFSRPARVPPVAAVPSANQETDSERATAGVAPET
jgi:putative colanic acid biosynthesis UDP-glucose lipid carrier transferase